jgi:hypothetical protein
MLLPMVFAATGLAVEPVRAIEPDLVQLAAGRGGRLINCTTTANQKDGRPAIHFDDKHGGCGLAVLDAVTFANGEIEFDARGKNVVQQSFVGVAFHGGDVKTYDAIYFRPFNFRSDDPARRSHAVQYISPPTHTWQKLREQFPGKYENAVTPVPDPDGWFHARIVVAWPKVSVFVNDAKEPSLVVNQLSDRKRGWVALWADVSGGDFANLKITPAPAP